MTIRFWPFYIWFHITYYRVWSQGGRWYDNFEVPFSPEWYAAPPRDLTKGIALRCGFTWSNKRSYRSNDRNWPAKYLILGDDQ